MRRIGYPILLLALIFLLLAACGKSKFEVEFSLPQDYSSALRIAYFATSKKQAFAAETTISIENGKAKLTAPGHNPMVVALMPLSTSAEPFLMFYAEKGDKIVIKGESGDPLTWQVGGNDINKEWSAWRIDNLDALKSHNAAKINKAVAEFVKKNPENPLSTLLLLTTFDRKQDDALYTKSWNMLKGEAKKLKYIDAVGRSDQIDEIIDIPAEMPQLEMYVKGDSMYTFKAKDNHKTLILFWDRQTPKRKELIDTLKDIRKEFGDSAKTRLIDISFDPDTVAWSHQLPADSVKAEQKSWTRGWMPAGVMNSQLIPLQIADPPFIIVVDKKGKQLYRGNSLNAAKQKLK